MLINRLAALLARAPRSTNRKALVSRLALESLETREVPAANAWLGGNFWLATSWGAGHLPQATDDVIFNAASPSLNVPLGINLQVNSVQLQSGFTGSVVFGPSATSVGSVTANEIDVYGGSVTTGSPVSVTTFKQTGGLTTLNGATMTASNFSLSGGTFDQPTAGSDITVTGALNWTNGTLNSTANVANVNLNGAVATVTPTSAGTVTLGDNFITSNGTSLTFNPGTIVWNNGNGIDLGAGTSMLVNAETPLGGCG